MKQLKRTLLTLVALIAVTTGAWATVKSETLVTNQRVLVYTGEHFKITANKLITDMLTVSDLRDEGEGQVTATIETLDGQNISQLDFSVYQIGETSIDAMTLSSGSMSYDSNTHVLTITNVNATSLVLSLTEADQFGVIYFSSVTYYYEEAAGTPVAITWDDATKTATIDKMPAGNVTVTPAYFKQAEFADQGAPEAIADVLANTDAPLVSEGQVKNIEGTETPQGTVMYYAMQQDGNTIPDAPDYDADGWTDQVPTADGLQKGKVYVWYYILGAEPAQGTDRTDDNTCSDSNITPLGTDGYVVLGPEPVYTVEFAQGTNQDPNSWTVDPTQATDPGVTKDTKVTLTYQGPRKVIGVKAEKKGAKPVTLATALENGAVVVIDYIWTGNTTFTFTNDNGTYSCNVTGDDVNYFTGSSLTYDGNKLVFTATHSQVDSASLSIEFYPSTNSFYIAQKGSNYQSFTISVNSTDIKSQLKEEK